MKYIVEDTKLTAIADAIREKTESTEAMTLDEMAENIAGISNSGISLEWDVVYPMSSYAVDPPAGSTQSYAIELNNDTSILLVRWSYVSGSAYVAVVNAIYFTGGSGGFGSAGEDSGTRRIIYNDSNGYPFIEGSTMQDGAFVFTAETGTDHVEIMQIPLIPYTV